MKRIDSDRAGDMRSSEVVRAAVLRLAQKQKSALATTFQELLWERRPSGRNGSRDDLRDSAVA